MSKFKSVLLIMACGVILGGCGSSEVNTMNGATGSALDIMDMDVALDITVGGEEPVSIPDPAQVKGEVSVVLHEDSEIQVYDDKYMDDEISETEFDEYFNKFKSCLYADLSFAGFENKVLVTSFDVGTVTKKDSSTAQIHNINTGKEETKPGNCLVLHIADGIGVDMDDEESYFFDQDNYLLFLDYGNKTFYKVKTDFFVQGYCNWVDMEFADLTGDGLDELLIQHCYNRGISGEVYRYDAQNHGMKKIYSTYEEEGLGEKFTFYGKLKDDYKVEIGIKEIGFSKEISLLDAGHEVRELDMAKEDGDDPYDVWITKLWKDKKLQKKDLLGRDVELDHQVGLYTIDDIIVENNAGEIPELIIRQYVRIGHRSFWAGDLFRHLQYDEKTDGFVVTGAELKIDRDEYEDEYDEYEDEYDEYEDEYDEYED